MVIKNKLPKRLKNKEKIPKSSVDLHKPGWTGGIGGIAPEHRQEYLNKKKERDKKKRDQLVPRKKSEPRKIQIDNLHSNRGGIGPKWSWHTDVKPDNIRSPSFDNVKKFDDVNTSINNNIMQKNNMFFNIMKKKTQKRLPNGELLYDSYGNPIWE
jgi:hypothetical protein